VRAPAVAALLALVACQPSPVPGAACERASDCTPPLACAVGRCRAPCASSLDCPTLARCIVEPATGIGVCSLPAVDECARHECPLGFVCRSGSCLNACDAIPRCPDGRCEDGACVPPNLPALDAGPTGDAGPATPHTLTLAADSDDGEISDTMLMPQGEIRMTVFTGYGAGMPTWSFLRFTLAEAIPRSATVSAAHLNLEGTGIWRSCSTSDHLAITADESGDAPATTATTDVPGGATALAQTSPAIAWGPLGDWPLGPTTSPDLSPLLQGLVDRHGGLAAGAHVRLWLAALDFTHDCEVQWLDSSSPGQDDDPTLTATW